MNVNELAESMGECFILYRELGAIHAKLNWIKCRDPDGKSRDWKSIKHKELNMEKRIKTSLVNIELNLGGDELAMFKNEYTRICKEENEAEGEKISIKHMPIGLVKNAKAFLNKTRCKIPEDIELGLSFGWKFLFPYTVAQENIHSVIAQLDHCITECVPEILQHEAFIETARILKTVDHTRHNGTTQWLAFLAIRTREFFGDNSDIFAIRSDKGAGTVMVYLNEYQNAIENMLNDRLSYALIDSEENILAKLIERESRIMNILGKMHQCDDITPDFYEQNTKVLACFYGLPKIHKENFVLRPIVSMNRSPGYSLGKVFNEMLKRIFPVMPHHVRDSYDMKDFVDRAIIRDEDMLTSFDVISMYTNIPRELATEIIMQRSGEFHTIFGIGKRILVFILEFLLVDSVVFTSNGKTYKQIRGLAMGTSVSPTMARIVMDRVVEYIYNLYPDITFIKVFVDDTLAAVKRGMQHRILESLNAFNEEMKFTMEEEDSSGSVNFLNLTVTRDENFLISIWYRKPFASGRLLNFYSAHKRSTIMGTAENFIKTILQLSNPEFFHANKEIVIETLRDNSFTETAILALMNQHYTYMKPGGEITPSDERAPKEPNEINYGIFPHAISESKKIKAILQRLKSDDVVLAESTRNTKINFVTTKKDKIPWQQQSNLILIARCKCGKKHKIKHTEFNENGQMLHDRMTTTFGECNGNKHAFKNTKPKKGLHYRSQTKYLMKYLKHKYYNKSIYDNNEMPNYHLAKLIKKQKLQGDKSNRRNRQQLPNKSGRRSEASQHDSPH